LRHNARPAAPRAPHIFSGFYFFRGGAAFGYVHFQERLESNFDFQKTGRTKSGLAERKNRQKNALE